MSEPLLILLASLNALRVSDDYVKFNLRLGHATRNQIHPDLRRFNYRGIARVNAMNPIDRQNHILSQAIDWAKGDSFASIARKHSRSTTTIRHNIYGIIRKLRRDYKCKYLLAADLADTDTEARRHFLKSFENLLKHNKSQGFIIPTGIERIITSNTGQKTPITKYDLKKLVDDGVIYPGFAFCYQVKSHNKVLELLGMDPVSVKKNEPYENKCIEYLELRGYKVSKNKVPR